MSKWTARYLLDIEPKLSVFKNHHDTWSYLVEATTASGAHVTIKGRARLKRDAAEIGEHALEFAERACWSLEREAYARIHNPGCLVLLDWGKPDALCSCGADKERLHPSYCGPRK